MNRPNHLTPSDHEKSSPFAVQLLVGLALVAAVPVALWILADPAAALLTVTAAGVAALVVVGAVETVDRNERGGD